MKIRTLTQAFRPQGEDRLKSEFMRQGLPCIIILWCFGALFLICYAPALFSDRQFGYRDAGNYYYPLNKRVQAEWERRPMAALGTRGKCRNAAAGEPHGGSLVSRQTCLRLVAVCLGGTDLCRWRIRALLL